MNTERCQLGDLPCGTKFGSDISDYILTDVQTNCEGESIVVNLFTGRSIPMRNSTKLAVCQNGKLRIYE